MEILVQLKDELGRLYIAGSKNAVNDPRIKKYIEPLEKLAEKSKVFEALKVGVQGLVNGTEDESFANLSKVYALVNSVLTTQCEFSFNGEATDLEENELVYENMLSYKELYSYLPNYNDNVNRKSDDNATTKAVTLLNKDARLFRFVDEYCVAQNRLDYLGSVLHKIDNSLVTYFIQNFEPKNTVGCLDRLEYMHKKLLTNEDVFNNKVVPLAKKVIEENHAKVIPTAIEVLGHNPENIDIILGFSKRKGAEYLQSSLIALYTLGTGEFEKIFKEVGEKNLQVATDVLLHVLPNTKNVEKFESYVDLVFDKYLALLDHEKVEFSRGWLTDEERIVASASEILSILSYDKYHTYFEKMFKTKWILNTETAWGQNQETINNLIANDLRYNQLIFDSVTQFFAEVDESSSGKSTGNVLNKFLKKLQKNDAKLRIFPGSNQIYYYYLIVIKNLFDEKKVDELTFDFIQICKDTDLMTSAFKNKGALHYEYLLRNLNKKIEIYNGVKTEIYSTNTVKNEVDKVRAYNPKCFDFLFNETYIYQNQLGAYSEYNHDVQNTVRLLQDCFVEKPELEKVYLEKLKDFILNKIDHKYFDGATQKHDNNGYHIENLLILDNENFARTFFDIIAVIAKDCPDVNTFNYNLRYIKWFLQNNNTNQNYFKYKYLLEEKQYDKIREFFVQFI